MKRRVVSIRPVLCFIMMLVPSLLWGVPSVKIISDAYEGKVEVDETFHITIEATDCAGSIDVSSMPPGVKVVYHTTRQASKVSTFNGKTEQIHTTSLIMTCKGVSPGNYTFGPVYVDGKKSNSISYKVVPAGAGNNKGKTNRNQTVPDPNSGPLFIGKGNEEMYLRASVNKTSVYEQEAIEYTVKLFTTYGDIKFLGAAAAPKFDGFVVEESPNISSSFKFEDINGKTFKTAVIARYIIFPQKAGNLKIQGNTYTISTDARQYYHDPYFQTITVKTPIQLNVTPNEVDIMVKDLPSPVPDNFIGGVGNFKIESELPSSSGVTNSAFSLIYKITGIGNIKYIKLPEIADMLPNSFELYTPDISTEAKVSGDNMEGSAIFNYSIIPRETGSFEIPSLNFSYFDPESGNYKTLHTTPLKVDIGMGDKSDKSQQTMSFNSELLPIGRLYSQSKVPYVNTFLYWLWYVVPIVIFVVTLGIYRKHLRERDDMVIFRSKNANKMAMKRLAKAFSCLKNNNEKEFYDEMLSALWGYLADKLQIPTSELNRANVSEEFKKHGVQESSFQPIINLIDECEYAKYTPVSRGANMKELYAEALDSLSKVEKEYEEKDEESKTAGSLEEDKYE